jgi:hypothetical protein
MKLSKLNELPTSRDMIDVFGGYNHNLRISEGEFYDMTNLTSNDYPVLSPRPQRGAYQTYNEITGYPPKPLGMITKDAFCYVEEDISASYERSYFFKNNNRIPFGGEELSNAPKTLISMGSYVIIMPDKYYINLNNDADKGKIEAIFEATEGTVKYNLCKLDGEDYTVKNENISATAPANPNNEDLWIDTSSVPHTLKQYTASTEQWVSIATTYIKISFPNTTTNLTDLFSDGDGVTISGINVDGNSLLNSLDGTTMVAMQVGADYIIVTGILDKVAEQDATSKPLKISRLMPEMDFVIESGNRLWGCRYGVALNGEVVNEIYASKLGDFKNWNVFAGISTDSYVASVGTDGQFTGATTHLGYPLFFKENYMHKVYGNFPANYQIQTTACRGVQKGCSKSLAIVNEVLYYKSRSAVCAYDGSLPAEISSALGDEMYSDAVAGVIGNKYYISMKDTNNEYSLFVYDTAKGMWHREDNTQADGFCNCDGELYYIDHKDNRIRTVRGSGDKDTSDVKWEAITGIIGTDSPDKKYISRIVMRLSLEVGTRVYVFADYDSSGAWEHLFSMTGTSLKTFSIPIRARRCDHLRLKLQGEGGAKIFSICKTIEQGSDV